jgi:hypothetical protein
MQNVSFWAEVKVTGTTRAKRIGSMTMGEKVNGGDY